MMIKPWLIRLVPKTRQYIAGDVIANWIGLIANIFVVTSIARLLEDLYNGRYTAAVGVNTLLTAGIAIAVRIICAFFASNMSFHASDEVKRILRQKIYKKLVRLGLSYTDKIGTAEAVQVAGEGVDQLEIYFGSYLPQLFYSLLAPVTLFVVFVRISVLAAVVLLICLPLIPLAIIGVQKIAKRLLKQYWGVYADLGGTFLDNVQGLTTLKIYEADAKKHEEMNAQSERFRRITMKVLYMQLNSITVMDVIAYGGAAAGMIIAVLEYQAGNITIAGAVTIILLAADFFIPLRQLGSFFHVAMNGMAASDKMKALFDLDEGEEKTGTFPDGDPGLLISDVSFSYDQKREVLHHVSMDVEPGSFVSLVGESGCGKSTIAALASGISKGYGGSIRYGSHELSELNEDSVMSHVTVVTHNEWLFRGTVRDNLLMADPSADEEKLNDALREANIYDFLQTEQGLDTEISEQGLNLSGGQRQRIAIARALLHDTPFYIFDEATSNIDMESEEAIMETIRHLAGRKTVLLISHRLANVVSSDRIYVMEEGKVVESGTHEQLMAGGGVYSRLFRTQESLENYKSSRNVSRN